MIPERMKFMEQFEGIYRIESESLLTHVHLFRRYLDVYGLDEWARRLSLIIKDEFKHLKMTTRLLALALSLE